MNSKVRKLLTDSKELNANERALLAHCLISSLDSSNEEDVEACWLHLAEERLKEYESGQVQLLDWSEIKLTLGN
jgi:hypothetical protein